MTVGVITSRDRLSKLQQRYAPYLFIAPFVILFLCFMLYPMLRSIVLSVHVTAGPRHQRFVGLGNYYYLLRTRSFWLAAGNTALFTILFVALQIPLSLGLAVLLDSPRVRFRSAFRFAFFSTHLVGSVFVAVLAAVVLSPRQGMLNRLLGGFGRPIDINWLGDPDWVLPSLLLAALWISVGFGMIYFLAALQSVDRELYEAAAVDGATPWQRFCHVTLPGIRPVLVFLVIVATIGGFQLFELPWVLFESSAGPGARGVTIVMYLYQQGFEAGNLGLASAVGWLLVLMIGLVSFTQMQFMRATREAHE